jgi:hypothetical protein
MLKDVLNTALRVLALTIIILALAATIGIPAGKRGPAAAQPRDEPSEQDLDKTDNLTCCRHYRIAAPGPISD